MARLIILIAVIGIALIVWHKIKQASGDKRKKLIFWSILGSVGGILAILAVTGHLNIITAMIAGMVALLPRAMSLLKYLPFINRIYQQNKSGQSGQNNQQHGQQQSPPQGKQAMSEDEALDVLGLKPGCNEDDIKLAHRRMMQKVHPDRGGSDYLAAQINTAKDVLMG